MRSRRIASPWQAGLVAWAVTAVSVIACHAAPLQATPSKPMTADRRSAPPAASVQRVSLEDFAARTYDDGKGHKLPYRLFAPAGRPRTARSHPLVVFLHGAGGRGIDNRGQIADQDAALVFVRAENQARWPAFMLAPQCPPDQQWVDMPWGAPTGKGRQPPQATWPLAATMALIDDLLREHPEIDPGRLYVTGLSMGGYGAWDAVVRHPKKWRGAVIVCGGYDPLTVAPLVKTHLPIWAFHGADDQTVPVERSREMIAALRALGGAPRYTEYPASARHGHFSWVPAFADPALLPWIFGSPRRAAAPVTPRR